MQNSDFWTRPTSLYRSQTSPVVLCIQNCVISARKPVSMGPSPHLWFCMQNSDFWTIIKSLYGYQTSPVVMCIQNSVLSTRISRLYGFHRSLLVLCMQNGDFRTRITSLCGSKTRPAVFACKTATSGLE